MVCSLALRRMKISTAEYKLSMLMGPDPVVKELGWPDQVAAGVRAINMWRGLDGWSRRLWG